MPTQITYHVNMEYELPLFPLNTVLFPGMPLTLHIFEDRYKLLINQCLQAGKQFGVVLIRNGVEAMGPLAEPHRIGCTAEVAQVQPLLGGRMNILVIGKERFRIIALEKKKPYLTGRVENFPLDMIDETEVSLVSEHLRPWVEEYLALLSAASDVEFDVQSLPDDPQALAFLAATILQIPNLQKQELLSASGTSALLSDMHSIYRRELPVLRLLLQADDKIAAGPGPFSLS